MTLSKLKKKMRFPLVEVFSAVTMLTATGFVVSSFVVLAGGDRLQSVLLFLAGCALSILASFSVMGGSGAAPAPEGAPDSVIPDDAQDTVVSFPMVAANDPHTVHVLKDYRSAD